MIDSSTPRAALAQAIPRRRRVSLVLGVVLALGFAAVLTGTITVERWLGARFDEGQPAPYTVRIPPLTNTTTGIGEGGFIVARGDVIKPADLAKLGRLDDQTPRGAMPYAALFALAAVLALLFVHHAKRSSYGRLARVQVVNLGLIVVTCALVKIVLLTTAVSILVVPVAALTLVPTVALDRVVGLATGVLAALAISLLAPFDVGVAIVLLVQVSVAGLVAAEKPKSRIRAMFVAGSLATVATALVYPLLHYLTSGHFPTAELDDPWHSAWVASAIGPALGTALALIVTPLYQLGVGEITRGKLYQLEDLSHPLLQQISSRSPGTWQHSLAMANMAQIAADKIGADGRLVRVGAYFHDLGKSLHPKYFIENIEPGETSPHDQLPPEVSCDAIFAHVTEGIAAARRAGLHERIVDFMHMHHGNGVLEYFWAKCREQGNPRGLTIEQFRYPGHPPQSRETAILTICDAVEAASRTLKKTDAAAIDSLVQRIVYGKLHLGQLDESGLSMSDLRIVADALRETIKHANHGRIEYPWQKEQAAQEAAAATPSGSPAMSTGPRLDSLDRPAKPELIAPVAAPAEESSGPVEMVTPAAKRPTSTKIRTGERSADHSGPAALADTADLRSTDGVRRPTGSVQAFDLAGVRDSDAAFEAPTGRRAASSAVPTRAPARTEDSVARAVPTPVRATRSQPIVVPVPEGDELVPGARISDEELAIVATAPVAIDRTAPPSGGAARDGSLAVESKRPTMLGLAGAPAARPTSDPALRASGLIVPVPPSAPGREASGARLMPSAEAAAQYLPPRDGSGPRIAPVVDTKAASPRARVESTRPSDDMIMDTPPPVSRAKPATSPDALLQARAPSIPPIVAPGLAPLTSIAPAPQSGDTGPGTGSRPTPVPVRPTPPPVASTPVAFEETAPIELLSPSALSAPLAAAAPRPSSPFSDRSAETPIPTGDTPMPFTIPSTLSGAPPPRPPAVATPPQPIIKPSIMPGPIKTTTALFPSLRTPSAPPPVTATGMPPPPPVPATAAVVPNPPPPQPVQPRRQRAVIVDDETGRSLRFTAEQLASDGDDLDAAITARGLPAGDILAAATRPSDLDTTNPRLVMPLPAPPVSRPDMRLPDKPWAKGLAARIDAALDGDDPWGGETPVMAPTAAELRALLGVPDTTRKLSLDEVERLHRAAQDEAHDSEPDILVSRPTTVSVSPHVRRMPPPTTEVDADDIESEVEIAPPARRGTAIGVVKKKPPQP